MWVKRGEKHFYPGTMPWYFLVYIPPYIIFGFHNARSPDLHIVEGYTINLFGSRTHGECHCFGPIDFIHSVAQTSPKHFYSLILTLINCVVAVSHIFASAWKYFSVLKNITILNFFKCVTISHPLNPGATPWYLASSIKISPDSTVCHATHKPCEWQFFFLKCHPKYAELFLDILW